MNRLQHASLLSLAGLGLLGFLSACRPEQVEDVQILQVGIIASLVEPARSWGLATVRCARVVADYHNDQGGFDLDDRKVMIELVVKDDQYDVSRAADVAHELVHEGVRYVIGPLGDAQVSSAAQTLDASSVFYVHYGFNQDMLSGNSLGVLGMPKPEQSLPVLFQHLREAEGVNSVLTMAYSTEEGIRQKKVAEYVAQTLGFELIRLSRFDISEEAFSLDLDSVRMIDTIARVVAAEPDALLVAGCPPELFVVFVSRMRSAGYTGFICTQNFQDPRLLAQLGPAAEDVFIVGGMPPGHTRNAYYESLKARYLDIAGEWSEEADVKLYALEFILACLRHAGPSALEDTAVMHATLSDFEFYDPFSKAVQRIPVRHSERTDMSWQLQLPIRISRMSGGEALLVAEGQPYDRMLK